METPVISAEAASLSGFEPKEAAQNLAKEQPFIVTAVLAEYFRLPKAAFITYGLLREALKAPINQISRETVEALDSVIQTDKTKLGEEFRKEQPSLGDKMMEVYGYIPKPALLVYFGYKNQYEADVLNSSNLHKTETEDEKQLKYLVSQVYHSLPSNKDWLDPVLEAQMKDIAAQK